MSTATPPKRNNQPIHQAPSLSCVTKQSKPKPDRIIIHGPPGWGKTSFAANLNNSIYITTKGEDGLQTLINTGQLPPTAHFAAPAHTWLDLELAVNELIVQEHTYHTFIIDTANGAERLGHEKICQESFDGDWGERGFGAFGRGEKTSTNQLWKPMLELLDRLRETRSMRIVLICHSDIRNHPNPNGPDYLHVEPALSRPAWLITKGWADMILCGAFEVFVEARKGEKQSAFARGKASGGQTRILYTQPSATHDAKNRHGLPAEITLGDSNAEAWQNFLAAFPKKGTAS